MVSVETGQMSAVETGQMTAAETSVLSQQCPLLLWVLRSSLEASLHTWTVDVWSVTLHTVGAVLATGIGDSPPENLFWTSHGEDNRRGR